MKTKQIKQGLEITAIDECIIDGVKTLTIGRKYTIEHADEVDFCIKDDDNTPHWFYVRNFDEFFKL